MQEAGAVTQEVQCWSLPPLRPLFVQTPAFLRILLLGFLAIPRTRGRVVPSVGRGRPGLQAGGRAPEGRG
jgi:hypothetical protein